MPLWLFVNNYFCVVIQNITGCIDALHWATLPSFGGKIRNRTLKIVCCKHPKSGAGGGSRTRLFQFGRLTCNHKHFTRINNFMHIYDAVTQTGLHIHLSMNEEESFYILVYDIDNFMLTMRFFNRVEPALAFIQSLWVSQPITKSYIN